MDRVKAKKHFGQHFLKDAAMAEKITQLLSLHMGATKVLEIGPGMGILTRFLLQRNDIETYVCEIDAEAVAYLKKHFPELSENLLHADFMQLSLSGVFSAAPLAIIGNFPYNISSQILFKVYENRQQVTEVVGMFQKEVAERIASPPGSRKYGILSVLLQAFYTIEYHYTLQEHDFSPPPKVKSGVLRLQRNTVQHLPCKEDAFKILVKTAFNQRRKTLRNSLKALLHPAELQQPLLNKRPEQLTVNEFVEMVAWMKE